MPRTIYFTLRKDTKGAHAYEEVENFQTMRPMPPNDDDATCGALYLRKLGLRGKPAPKTLTVTINDLD
jgi:hypothetical protein